MIENLDIDIDSPYLKLPFLRPWPSDCPYQRNARPDNVDRSVSALDISSYPGNEWVRLLPELDHVEYLNCGFGRFGQSMLDAVSKMTWLKGLRFGQLRAEDLSGIGELTSLEFFSAQQLTSAKELSPVLQLPRLECLVLGISRYVTTLDEFRNARLPGIRALEIFGSSDAKQPILDSLEPLSGHTGLEYFGILAQKIAQPGLSSFKDLKSLRRLILKGKIDWSDAHIEMLREQGVDVSF